MAKALLLVVADPPSAMEEEFNAWYDTEHLPERAIIPGFNTARRFVSLGDGPAYMALYDLDQMEVLDTPAYQAVYGVNFSPWTRRVTARVSPIRLAGVQTYPGQAITGVCTRLVMVRLRDVTEADQKAVAQAMQTFKAAQASCTQVRVFACDQGTRQDGLVLLEFAGPDTGGLSGRDFGAAASKIDLFATYRPYRMD